MTDPRPPLDISQPKRERPALDDKKKAELDRIAAKQKSAKTVSDFEIGTLASFAAFYSGPDADRAALVLARAKRQAQKQKEAKK